MSSLAQKRCVPCSGSVAPLALHQVQQLHGQLAGGWQVLEQHHLEKVFHFSDFKAALAFTNCVGAIAEAEGHHPDIALSYGRVEVRIFTHAIDGLSESDFVLAAKIDAGCT